MSCVLSSTLRLLSAVVVLPWGAMAAEPASHWAFVPPQKSQVPVVEGGGAPVDAFIGDKLRAAGLDFALPAASGTWLRRVTFALTGLPPSPEEIAAFSADDTPAAREAVVDRLLASPAYGEEMARQWLDAARYADSYGRHEDTDAYVWPWRDWVIQAFNGNLPYDAFVQWQTAGDLLPNATKEQRTATTFNRLAQQSNESGSNETEFRLDQVADRVKTTSTAFLGLTMDCARCHDHKFDPISQREYWQVAAFFDNIDERGVYSQYCPLAPPSPSMPLYSGEQEKQLAGLQERLGAAEAALAQVREEARPRFRAWVSQGLPEAKPRKGFLPRLSRWLGVGEGAAPLWRPDELAHYVFDGDTRKKLTNATPGGQPGKLRRAMHTVDSPTGKGLRFIGDDDISLGPIADFHRHDAFSFALWLRPEKTLERGVVLSRSKAGTDDGRGYEMLVENGRLTFAISYFFPGNEVRLRTIDPLPLNEWTHLAVTCDGSGRAAGMKLYVGGRIASVEVLGDSLSKDIVRRPDLGDKEVEDVELQLGGRLHDLSLKRCSMADFWVFGRALAAAEVQVLIDPAQRPPADDWFEWYLAAKDAPWQESAAALKKLRAEWTELVTPVPELMVMRELAKPRPRFLYTRGDWRQPAGAVEPGTPAHVLEFPADLPRNRLGFAQWLTHPGNPLTARVEVNRVWQQLFGAGFIKTPEDFGVRSEKPELAALLDWLAVDFREHGWDVKRLVKTLALSRTFAQDSRPSAAALAKDPDNRLWSRGPSGRLSAEEIRDQALAAAGLLVREIGGAPVRPYLPERIYKDSGLQQHYTQDHGGALHRRSLYTFWRRTLPPPDMTAFDAPTREYCLARRTATSTPAQALVLLNDPQFLEVSRVLAEHLVKEGGPDDEARVRTAFWRLTGREPAAAEQKVLAEALRQNRADFTADEERANQFLQHTGETPRAEDLPAADVAATTLVIRALLGHEETLHLH